MEGFVRVLNIIDQYNLTHLEIINSRDFIKDFEIVET